MVSGKWLKLKDIGDMGEWEKREAGKEGSWEAMKLGSWEVRKLGNTSRSAAHSFLEKRNSQ